MAGQKHPNNETTSLGGANPVPEVDVAFEKQAEQSKIPWGRIVGAGALVLALGVGSYAVSSGDSELQVAQEVPQGPVRSEPDEGEGEREEAESTDAESIAQGSEPVEPEDEETEPIDPEPIDSEPNNPVVEPEDEETEPIDPEPIDSEPNEPVVEPEDEEPEDETAEADIFSVSRTVFDGERFAYLITRGNGWTLQSSTDGLNWVATPVTGIDEMGLFHSELVFENGTYVALLNVRERLFVASSTDGVSWTTSAEVNIGGDHRELSTAGLAVQGDRVIVIQSNESENTTLVLAGPVSGPFVEISTLPSGLYYGSLHQTDAGLFVDGDDGSRAAIFASTDGSSWIEVTSPSSDQLGLFVDERLESFGDVLLLTSTHFDPGFDLVSRRLVSTDGAQTWTESSLEHEFGHTRIIAGEAGLVAVTQGTIGSPGRTVEVHFSLDGATWTALRDERFSSASNKTLISASVVGDDYATFAITTALPNGWGPTEYVRIELG